MKIGQEYKNYNELKGLFTYKVKEINNNIVTMDLIYPESWNVSNYKTFFDIVSVQMLLAKFKNKNYV